MPIPIEALELENQYLRIESGEDSPLAAAYEILKQEWDNGNRDRELALHLMFLAWYGLCEPAYLTGFETKEGSTYMLKDGVSNRLQMIFQQVHDYFEPEIRKDFEMLFVVGLMAELFPYLLGNSDEWERRSVEYRKYYRELKPEGISPEIFANRGAYGEYFYRQAKVENGY
jgi:hypothetical protein